MSSQFLSLEEAAKKLGLTTEKLVSLRSEGKVRGFRDGASWKFPASELDRLAEDLSEAGDDYDPYKIAGDDEAPTDSSGDGSGVMVDDLDLGSAISSDDSSLRGSDVNLVAGDGDGDGSDVQVVSKSEDDDDSDFTVKGRHEGLVELDSGELQLSLNEPALTHESEVLDLAIDPKTGSTGPIAKRDQPSEAAGQSDNDLTFDSDNDSSGEDLLGLSDSGDLLGDEPAPVGKGSGSASGSSAGGSSLSSLELMDDLDIKADSGSGAGSKISDENDVLSEFDLLGADGGGSGLISGDSGNVLGSDVGKSGGSSGKGSNLSLSDDDDDDDLLITDNDDELVLGGSDLSMSGDSGINLMSPSDSGISLESEPLDLAGSSISALDLGLEVGSGVGSSGKGSGLGSDAGSGVGGEDFQLSPSGISVDNDSDSSSQVIEVEDSAFAEDPAALEGADFGEALDDGDEFAESDEGGFGDEEALAVEDEFGDETVAVGGPPVSAYEVPFSIFQVVGLVCVVLVMGIGGMLMSDLVRNMWTYSEPAAPVSGLTDWLIEISPFDK